MTRCEIIFLFCVAALRGTKAIKSCLMWLRQNVEYTESAFWSKKDLSHHFFFSSDTSIRGFQFSMETTTSTTREIRLFLDSKYLFGWCLWSTRTFCRTNVFLPPQKHQQKVIITVCVRLNFGTSTDQIHPKTSRMHLYPREKASMNCMNIHWMKKCTNSITSSEEAMKKK